MPKSAPTTELSNTDIAGYKKRFKEIAQSKIALSEEDKDLSAEAKGKGIDVKAMKFTVMQELKPMDKGFKERVNYYMSATGQLDMFVSA